MRNLKALLFKLDDNGNLRVRGPLSADRARGIDADYILLMCDYNTMVDPKNKRDVDTFRHCLSSSPIYAADDKQMKTLGYAVGTLTGVTLPDLDFSSIVYEG